MEIICDEQSAALNNYFSVLLSLSIIDYGQSSYFFWKQYLLWKTIALKEYFKVFTTNYKNTVVQFEHKYP